MNTGRVNMRGIDNRGACAENAFTASSCGSNAISGLRIGSLPSGGGS